MDTQLDVRFDRALAMASDLHRSQCRKGTSIPYISHPLAVASLVIENGGDEEEAIAALLHDAVEDQGGRKTLETIQSEFGDRVAGIVEACSDTDVQPKPPWRERKQAYLDHLRHETRPEVLRVSAADKLHNARCILTDHQRYGDRLWKRFNAAKEDQAWYYGELAKIFKRSGKLKILGLLARQAAEAAADVARITGQNPDESNRAAGSSAVKGGKDRRARRR